MMYTTAEVLAALNCDDPATLNRLIRESLEHVLVGYPLDGDLQVPIFSAPPRRSPGDDPSQERS